MHSAPAHTIVAQATPPGRGGVAILRVSGPLVPEVIAKMLRTRIQPRMAAYTSFFNAQHEVIDQGIALYFPNPNSFTGEDVLELHAHGGPVVVDMLLEHILTLDVKLAKPGEFTERAYLNNKIDLTQAEAIADLIEASSREAAKLAVRSLQGEFAKAIQQLVDEIIYLRTYVEAAIDFVEEEIDFMQQEAVLSRYQKLIISLQKILSSADQGNRLREGMKIVIAGQPNVGKSSLINCLSTQDIAIVTEIPGTTRDVLRTQITIDGLPIYIVDTAGIRESEDKVEQEGVRRAHNEMQTADLILQVLDATHEVSENLKPVNHQIPTVFVINKIDLLDLEERYAEQDGQAKIYLSVKTKKGIDLLKEYIKRTAGVSVTAEGLFFARRRHLDALTRAKTMLTSGIVQLTKSQNLELVAEELRLAHLALGEITGEYTSDDLLGSIFGSFCIGK